MAIRVSKITIIRRKNPRSEINQEIQWVCRSLGLFNERDKEKSCFRIFVELMKSRNMLSSDEVASRSNLSRATVIHHLHKLMDSGLVINESNKYSLRKKQLNKLVLDVKKDLDDTLKRMHQIAKRIDKELEKY